MPSLPSLTGEAGLTPVPVGQTSRSKLVILVGGLVAFAPLSIDMYIPALPAISRDLRGSALEVQLTLTAVLVGLALGQLVAGPVSDSLGRRRPLLMGLIAYTVASVFCALAPNVALLILVRLIQGACGSAGIVIGRAILRDRFAGTALTKTLSLALLVQGLAPVLAPLVGGQVLRFSSWRAVFLTLALLGLLMLVTVFFGLRETLPEETRRTGGIGETVATLHTLVHDRVFVGYALAAGLAFGALFSYISGSPFVLENIYGVSPQSFGWFFGANALGLVTATQLGARVVHRVGSRRVLATGLLMSAAGGLLLLAAVVARTGLLGILPGLFLTVSSIGLIVPNATALALADYRATAGSASALLGLAQYIIGAVAAPFVGIGGSHAALPMGVVIAIMGTGALLTFVLLTGKPERN